MLPWQPIKLSSSDTSLIKVENYSINYSVKIKFYYPLWDSRNFQFPLFHYKSIETLSCHSNQYSYPTARKNITFVEGNVLCKYAKFQLHPPYGFEKKKILNFFPKNYPWCRPVNQLNKAIWTKVVWNMEDYSINISVKNNSNIPNDLAEIVNFHFSHYKTMETLSCHSNQSSYPTEIKTLLL